MINEEYINQKVKENIDLELYKQTEEYKEKLIKNKIKEDNSKKLKKQYIAWLLTSITLLIIACIYMLIDFKDFRVGLVLLTIFSLSRTTNCYDNYRTSKLKIQNKINITSNEKRFGTIEPPPR